MSSGPPVYLDTCALMRRAEADCPSPTPRNVHAGNQLKSLLGAQDRDVALTWLTLFEFHNNVAVNWRRNDPPEYIQFDRAWASRATLTVMESVSDGSIVVLPTPGDRLDHALALVTLATREHSNGLRAFDALHILTAASWANVLQTKVELWTTDTDFERFLTCFPYFSDSVSVRNLDL